MIDLKVVLSAVCLWLFCSLSSPAFAVGDYNDWTWNNDIDYYKTTIDDSGIYADSTLTDWHWMIAGDPNDGTDNLDDGFCFMYDGGNYGGTPFAVYNAIDPSQCAFYNNTNYQGIEWYSFTDLNLIAEPDPAPIGIYQDQQSFVGVVDDETNIFGTGSSYWTGCFATGDSPTWADGQGAGGGECPIINNGSGQINWGYVQQTLTQISAIDIALKNAGLETYGYTYSWRVKNADANNESTNGAEGQDTLKVTLSVKDNGGNTVYEKEFDYSYWIDNWTQFSGDENFDTPFDLKTLDSIMLQVTGQDVGNWEGWYGPEFNNPNVVLKYRPIIEDNSEQLLFEQMCQNDPLYDMNCPGYQTAMLDQMNAQANIQDLGAPTAAAEVVANDGSINVEAVVQEPKAQEKIVGEPTLEVTNEQIAEVAEEATQETGTKEVQESSQAETADNSSTSEEKKGTGLSANQLMALNIAETATAAAQSTAATSATQSAGIGLSESGGVSSELTADGVSNADGSLNSSVASIVSGSNSQTNDSMGSSMGGGSQSQSFGDNGDISVADIQLNSQSMDTNTTFEMDMQTDTNISMNDSIDQTNQSIGQDISNNMEMPELDLITQLDIQQEDNFGNETFEMASLDINELSKLDLTNTIVDEIINSVTNNLIQEAAKAAEEIAEESAEESYEEQNAKEDDLVEKALSGDDSEDAQAALLGYNPKFREYQSPMLPDSQFYQPKDIYDTQKNYDNPNQRLFNGASDELHREMVRQQYNQ